MMDQLPHGGAFATLWKQTFKCPSNALGGEVGVDGWTSKVEIDRVEPRGIFKLTKENGVSRGEL